MQAREAEVLPVAILAGGLATRLDPLTRSVPKSLLDVAGQPFILHQLRLLRAAGIRRVILCVGHLGEQVQQLVGDGSQLGLQVEYAFDGPALRGTGGALKNALPVIASTAFFVLYGDSYLPCDYSAVAACFQSQAAQGLMTVYRNDGKWDRSNVEFAGGKIIAYDKNHQTPAMQYIDYGLGVLRSSALSNVPQSGPYDLASVYQDLLARGELHGFETHERFYEIGSESGLLELANYLTSGDSA